MPRAKLFHISGFPLHITHRCHNRDFLLKFGKDRKRWLYWLFQAIYCFLWGLNFFKYSA
ncbi:MAG: hypothetical protein ACE5LC_09960 [Candidatus Aminicenantales bacterium]